MTHIQQWEQYMTSGNRSFERLIDVVEGRVDEVETQRVLADVASDPTLAAAYGWVSGFASLA